MQCLEAKDRCIGYAFDFSKTDTQRVGSFWADVFNFRKKQELQGWSFKAVFVFVNDVLVHKVSNGEPEHPSPGRQEEPAGSAAGRGEYFSDKLR